MAAGSERKSGVGEDVYEREKVTRIMPQDLKRFGGYIMRTIMLLNYRPPYAFDVAVSVVDLSQFKENGTVSVAHENEDTETATLIRVPFNDEGFTLANNSGPTRSADFPEGLVPMGYLVGSTDPYDIALAELVVNARETAI